jgi:CCR4-NOT transcription complex subunit 2
LTLKAFEHFPEHVQMSDADLTMLSLGTDLTNLGLNLNSSDSLHKSLISPLADVPLKSE